MGVRSLVKGWLQKILGRYHLELVPSSYVYDWQLRGGGHEVMDRELPAGARERLHSRSQRLTDLQQQYRDCGYPACEDPVWTEDRVKEEDILYFRGHNAYIYQEGRFNRNLFGYLLAYYYIKSQDEKGLLERLEEDGAFGAITYRVDGRLISRDLLDSILEIYFLQRHLQLFQIQNLKVLDIGAGYGRLAHRMCAALPNLESYACTDAIPVSSFLAEYYLEYRKLTDRARMLPLDQVRSDLKPGSIDLALNIHSFSECALPAIEWWLDLLRETRVPYLMIVPNSYQGLLTNAGEDFQPLVVSYGYRQIAEEPKYLDPAVQKYGLNPDCMYLFQLQ